MPVFIKQHTTQEETETGIKVTRRDWTEEELAQLRKDLPSRFITVPESHAADVIRPQGNYQEIEDVPTPVSSSNSKPVEGGSVSGVQEQAKPQRESRRKTQRKVTGGKGVEDGTSKA